MPRICSRGTGAAYNFGFLGKPAQEPPGTYTMPMGWTGSSYQPAGWNTVDLVLRGAGGLDNGPYGKGTKLEKTGVPVASLNIYTPTTGSNGRAAQGGGAGSGGSGGSTSGPAPYRGKNGGGASAATWSGGSMIAAGGGFDGKFTMKEFLGKK